VLPARMILALAVRRRMISINPFSILTADDRPAKGEKRAIFVPTDDQIAGLLDASAWLASQPESRYNYAPGLKLTARLGAREGELLGLQWRDFDKDESTLMIERQWGRDGKYGPPKTRAGVRRIALPADLRTMLLELKLASNYKADTDPIFASKAGTPLTHRNLTRRGFEAARDHAELPKHFRFHDLRHYCASRLIANGLDPVTVANVLGHEDATTTLKVYSHLFDRQKTDERVRAALEGVAV
jgi:integrase